MKGHITQRAKNSWSIVLYLGRDALGKQRYKWQTIRGTKKDAERKLRGLLSALDNGSYVEPNRMNLGEYLNQWLNSHAKARVNPKTFERYSEIVRCDLIPALGNHQLSKLQPLHVQSYYATALENGRRDGKSGLSPRTVLHIHRLLKAALQQAVKWQLCAKNVCEAVEPPKPQRREMNSIDEHETALLLEAARETRLYAPILLAASTGLRRGELLALRWVDIDFEGAALTVRRSLEETKALGLRFKAPKTASGARIVSLPKLAVDALRKHRIEQAKVRLALGQGRGEENLVFPTIDGKPWRPSALSDSFTYVVARSGLGHLRLHDLRHSHASQLLRANVHPKVVSERLGHSTVGITLDTYSHLLPGLQREAADKVDAALGAELKA